MRFCVPTKSLAFFILFQGSERMQITPIDLILNGDSSHKLKTYIQYRLKLVFGQVTC